MGIGPLVGAIVAGLLLIVLMFNINNGENSNEQTKVEKHAYVNTTIETKALAYSFKSSRLFPLEEYRFG